MTEKFENEGLQIEARFLQSKSESNDEAGKVTRVSLSIVR